MEEIVVGGEGVMKVVDGDNVPRVTRQGALQEGALVVNEVGDDQVHELMRELGD